MPQDRRKEDLKKLLAFLGNIIREPENSWFVDELCSMLHHTREHNVSIDKIEKYLGLDYDLDTRKCEMDFSFVKDDYIRDCFISDYREMLRYRFGTRNHSINFQEYCRYALIISERVLNLYYSKFSTIREAVDEIKQFNPDAKFHETPKGLEAISFNAKLWGFCKKYSLGSIKWQFDNVREVRNMSSHGQISHEYNEERYLQHRQELLSWNFPLREDGTVNWNILQENMVQWNIYVDKFKKTSEHKQYIWFAWRRREPFDEIRYYLNELISFIASLLG